MNKQPAVTAATRQKLTEAFWKLLEKQELNRITVKEITDLADYNRGTFYQYFTDIYALVEDEEERILSAIREINAPKILQESPESLPGAIVPFIEQNKRKIALLLAKRGDVFLGKIKAEMYPFFLRSYEIPDTASSRILFSFVVGGITQALVEWQTNEQILTIGQVAPIIMEGLLEGPVSLIMNLNDKEAAHD